MNVLVRVVASLIATMLFSVAALAAPEKGNIGVDSFDASAQKVATVQSTVTVYRTAQGGYTLSPTAEVAFTAWAPSTSDTACGRVNEDGSLTMPIGKRLITNGNVCFKWGMWSSRGVIAPTGTTRVLEVLKPVGDEDYESVGVTTNWAKAQALLASNPTAFVSIWGVVAPVETKGLWVANEASAPDGKYGSYLDFTAPGFLRTDYTMGSWGFLSVDNSRETAYFTQGRVRVNVLKSATNNPLDLEDNTPLLTSLVDEVTGKLVVVEGGSVGGGVWIQDPLNPFTTVPLASTYLRARDVRNGAGLWDGEIIRAQLWGEWLVLWRASDDTAAGYTKGQLIVYNIRDWIDRGVRTTVTVQLPDAPAIQGSVRLGPPAFDPANRRFWVNYGLQQAYGSVTFSEDFSTATVGNMKFLPRENGADFVSPDAMYFDSSLNRLYIASHRYSNAAGYLAGELTAFAADGTTRLASLVLPEAIGAPGYPVSSPTDVAIAPRGGVNMIVVASSGTNTIVLIDPAMQVTASFVTRMGKHIAPAMR